MKTRHYRSLNGFQLTILLLVCLSLSMVFPSCASNTPLVDPSTRQTDVARHVEATLNAEKVATYIAQQTLDAGQPIATQPTGLNTNATIQAQQATLDARSTAQSPQETQPAPADTPQVTPTLPLASSSDPIQILDWKMTFWVSLPGGCKGHNACWRTNDDYKKHLGLTPMILTSTQSYLIDPNWQRPYLVFWNKRDISYPATVELIVDGRPMIVKQYERGQTDWLSEAIDLSPYKGKEISFRFSVGGKWGSGRVPGSEWYLENVQLIPSYKQK
jgi:hypothetical protein